MQLAQQLAGVGPCFQCEHGIDPKLGYRRRIGALASQMQKMIKGLDFGMAERVVVVREFRVGHAFAGVPIVLGKRPGLAHLIDAFFHERMNIRRFDGFVASAVDPFGQQSRRSVEY